MKIKLLLSFSLVLTLNAQDLKTTITEVLNTNPTIQERLKNYNATKEDITTAQSGYYPKINLNLGIGHENTQRSNQAIAPDATYDFSVYQNSLKYTQNLFNGFKTDSAVKEQRYKTLAASYSYVEKVNDTSFKTVDAYLQVMKNQELLKTAQENVKIDQDIFNKVQKLYNAGLTTLSEVNKIESSLALAKSNLVVQENSILDAPFKLQKLLGRDLDPKTMQKPTLDITLPASQEEAAQYAMQNNPSLLVGDYNIKVAQATHEKAESAYYPKLDIELSESMNKNLSGVEGNDDRFRAMAYLSYNIFNGFADSSATQKTISQISQQVESTNNLRRQVLEGLKLSWASNTKLEQQLQHLKDYKKYSLKTLKLYAKEYDLGRRSLLDLLSSQNDFIEAKSQIITTKYSLLFAKYRILDAMGTLVSTIMGNEKVVYSQVGIQSNPPKNQDSLPLSYDRDNDLIADNMDICHNSLTTTLKTVYGCAFEDANVSSVKRYGDITFQNDRLTNDANEKLDRLLSLLGKSKISKLKIALLGNAQDSGLSEEELLHKSEIYAQNIKEKLIKIGVQPATIKIYANADHAPLYSDMDDIRNNRVDIIVTKLK